MSSSKTHYCCPDATVTQTNENKSGFASLLAFLPTDQEKNNKALKALTACEVQCKPYELVNNSGKDDFLEGDAILLEDSGAKFGQRQLKTKHELMKASEVAELGRFSSIDELSCSRRVDNAKIGALVAAERNLRREIVNLMLKEWGGRGDGQGEYATRGRVIGRHFGHLSIGNFFGVGFKI